MRRANTVSFLHLGVFTMNFTSLGTNDAFVTIALGKEKFQTSVKEKSSDPVEWNEQCEL